MDAVNRKFCLPGGTRTRKRVAGPSSPPAAAILLDRRQTEEIAKTLLLTAPGHSDAMVAPSSKLNGPHVCLL